MIGLVGGIASGKSVVARMLSELGARVLDADGAGHEVLRDPEVIAAAVERWGRSVLTADGQLDRSRVAKIVFQAGGAGTTEREFLEQLTHPRIARLLGKQAADAAAAGIAAVVLDAPVLIEASWDPFCDTIVLVESSEEVRKKRARERGWNEAEFQAREAAQVSVDEKRQKADRVIENSGSSENTRGQVEKLWHSLVG